MSIASVIQSLTSVANPQNWFSELIGGGKTSSGVRINEYTAMTISTVWQAINVISGDVGQLPLSRYKRKSDDSREHDKDPLMETKPNPLMTPLKLKETLQSHAITYGNGYGVISRTTGKKEPTQIQVLKPQCVRMEINKQKRLVYKVDTFINGVVDVKEYKDRDILHIRGLGFDGLKGYSVVSLAADSFGMTKAAENHGASYFRNFATPQGILSVPGGKPKQDVIDQSKADWKKLQSEENEHDVAIMYGGMDFKPLSFTNKDSQFLESREFQRTEIASWFNLPPHKVGDLSRATFTNIEEQNRSYLTNSLMYWLVNWEQECNDKLLTESQRKEGYYYEFNTAALLKGDIKSRYEAYQIGKEGGWLNGNEIRKKENMNKADGLDFYTVPMNFNIVGEEPNEPEPVVPEQADESNIIRAAVTGIIRMEGNRIVKTSETAKNFTAAVDKFYNQHTDRLWEILEPMGATVQTLEDYIANSKSVWEDITGRCTQSELCETVTKQNESWSDRAEMLANLIIKDRNDAKKQTITT